MSRDTEALYESYPSDAFDNPPAGPVGVHRGGKSLSSKIVPVIIIIAISAICGVLAWSVMTGQINDVHWPWVHEEHTSSTAAPQRHAGNSDTSSASGDTKNDASGNAASNTAANSAAGSTSSNNASGASSAAASGNASNTAGNASGAQDNAASNTAKSQSDQASSTVNKATQVRVVNGTRIAGHAAAKASALKSDGYSNVATQNLTGSAPSSTVVWYGDEAQKATAQAVAAQLGISTVQQRSNLSSPIVVVLMN